MPFLKFYYFFFYFQISKFLFFNLNFIKKGFKRFKNFEDKKKIYHFFQVKKNFFFGTFSRFYFI